MTKEDLSELIDDHSQYIFEKEKNSSGTDDLGDEYDHAFPTEEGRVSYTYNGDDSYSVTLNRYDGSVETIIMPLEVLSGWFYNPSSDYFNTNVLVINTIQSFED